MEKKVKLFYSFVLINICIFIYPFIVSFGGYQPADIIVMSLVFFINLGIYFLILINTKYHLLTIFLQSIFTILNLYFYNFFISSLSIFLALVLSAIIVFILNILYSINSKRISLTFFLIFLINSILFNAIYSEDNYKNNESNYYFKIKEPKRNIYFIGIDAMVSKEFYSKFFSNKEYINETFEKLGYFSKEISSPGIHSLETYANLVSYSDYTNSRLCKYTFSNRNSQFYKDLDRLGYKKQFVYSSEYFGVDPNNVYDFFFPKKNTLFNFCTYIDSRWGCYFCKYFNKFKNLNISYPEKLNLFKKFNVHIFKDSNKWFSIIHIGFPGHSGLNYNPKNENDYKNFVQYYTNCQEELRNIVHEISNCILTNDEDAIIIFMGDHGSYLFRNTIPNDIIGNIKLTDLIIDEDKRKVLIAIFPFRMGELINEKIKNEKTGNLFRIVLESADSLSSK